MHLSIAGFERIVFTTAFGFGDMRPDSELAERLHEVDLFGLGLASPEAGVGLRHRRVGSSQARITSVLEGA